MEIRLAQHFDFAEIKQIFKSAISYMQAEGNVVQWQQKETLSEAEIKELIASNTFYVVLNNAEIIGCYKLVMGLEPTYRQIKGQWLNDELYATIHKIVVKYHGKGVADFMLYQIEQSLIKQKIRNLRIDTYQANVSMQKFLAKHGFIKCGVISLDCDFSNSDSLRLAYQKVLIE